MHLETAGRGSTVQNTLVYGSIRRISTDDDDDGDDAGDDDDDESTYNAALTAHICYGYLALSPPDDGTFVDGPLTLIRVRECWHPFWVRSQTSVTELLMSTVMVSF